MSSNSSSLYMYASSSDIVMATVIFSILMTLLGLNIIFYLICKFLSRPRTNPSLDVKQVKRIKVKSASMISKDFEKESMKLLMQQLKLRSPRRNSEISVLSQDDLNSDVNVNKNKQNKGNNINMELSDEDTKNKQLTDEDTRNKQCDSSISVENANISNDENGKSIFHMAAISLKQENIVKKKKNSGKQKKYKEPEIKMGGNSKRTGNHPGDLELKECTEIVKETSQSTGNKNEIQVTDLSLDCDLLGNEFSQNVNSPKSEECNVTKNIMDKQETESSCHDNNIVAITITTDDGLQSTINFEKETEITKS